MSEEAVTASLRVRMSHADAHYAGELVSGARLLELIHDVATELCIRHDSDEGLFAGYSEVSFLQPVHAGDFLEVHGTIVRVGNTSREMDFRVERYARNVRLERPSAAELLPAPEVIAVARGTCVVRASQD